MLLMGSYSFIFYIYTFRKSSLLKQFLSAVLLYGVLMGYVFLETDNEVLVMRIGMYYFLLVNLHGI